jgi:hypothetical protein
MRRAQRILVVVAVALAAPPARADDPPPDAAALEEAKQRFAEGQQQFENGELKPAVESFKEAYRLTKNPLLLYNIAFVYDKLGDDPLALHYYTKFVDEAQDSERTHDQLREASARAAELRGKLEVEAPPPPGEETQPAPEPALSELTHEVIDQAPPGQPIDVAVRVPRGAPWAVTLHYRAPGQDLYQSVKMKPRAGAPAATAASGEELVARIPAAAVRETALHYHVAARDPEGKLVGFSGKPQTPNVVYLDPKAPPHHYFMPGDAAPTGPAPPTIQIVRIPQEPTRPMTYAKWATSGGALVLVGTGVAFTLLARNHGEVVEAESLKSRNPEYCQNEPLPCRVYSQQIKDLESRGRAYETWGNITLIAGGAAAIAAGALWYLDSRPPPVKPIVGPGFSGAVFGVPF